MKDTHQSSEKISEVTNIKGELERLRSVLQMNCYPKKLIVRH